MQVCLAVPQVSEIRSGADFEREKLHSGVGQASLAHPGSSSAAPGISPTSDQHSGSLSIKSANDNLSASTSSTPAPVIPYEKAMDDQLALFRNSGKLIGLSCCCFLVVRVATFYTIRPMIGRLLRKIFDPNSFAVDYSKIFAISYL